MGDEFHTFTDLGPLVGLQFPELAHAFDEVQNISSGHLEFRQQLFGRVGPTFQLEVFFAVVDSHKALAGVKVLNPTLLQIERIACPQHVVRLILMFEEEHLVMGGASDVVKIGNADCLGPPNITDAVNSEIEGAVKLESPELVDRADNEVNLFIQATCDAARPDNLDKDMILSRRKPCQTQDRAPVNRGTIHGDQRMIDHHLEIATPIRGFKTMRHKKYLLFRSVCRGDLVLSLDSAP
nr:hypothetical protein [Novosphingobium sp. CECT 9465]